MRRFEILVLAMSLLAAGCGKPSPRQSVSGKITLDGTPVETGVITFLPAKGTSAPVVGVEISGGEYELDAGQGPLPGTFRVQIKSPKQTDKQVVVYPGAPPGFESVETIPQMFNTRSTLEVEITEGSNSHDFFLVSADDDAPAKKQ